MPLHSVLCAVYAESTAKHGGFYEANTKDSYNYCNSADSRREPKRDVIKMRERLAARMGLSLYQSKKVDYFVVQKL